MDWIQDSSTYQANSVIVATEEYIILNMHLIFTLDSYLSKSIFISIAFSFIQIQRILYLLSSIMIKRMIYTMPQYRIVRLHIQIVQRFCKDKSLHFQFIYNSTINYIRLHTYISQTSLTCSLLLIAGCNLYMNCLSKIIKLNVKFSYQS